MHNPGKGGHEKADDIFPFAIPNQKRFFFHQGSSFHLVKEGFTKPVSLQL